MPRASNFLIRLQVPAGALIIRALESYFLAARHTMTDDQKRELAALVARFKQMIGRASA